MMQESFYKRSLFSHDGSREACGTFKNYLSMDKDEFILLIELRVISINDLVHETFLTTVNCI